MSESLRKTLASRLQSSEKIRDKTPPLGRLVPKLTLNQDRSCTILKKDKLQPLSPFLTKRIDSITERVDRENIVTKLNEAKGIKRKFSVNKISKLAPIHFHSDTKFLGNNEVELLEFIKRIKENQDFHEDFWYFNKGTHAYDLVFTTFHQKNPLEYYTLSFRGISRFYHGEVQFVSLEEWERENYLFKKFSSIPFFNKYRKWKTFSLWMKKRRMNMIEQRRQFLKRTLCFLDEDLQQTFLNTRQKLYIVSKLDLLDLSLDQTRTLGQFIVDQKQKMELKLKDLVSFHENIFILIRSICLFTTDKFIRSNITGSILDKGEVVSSRVLPYTHEAVMRNHLQHLGKFVKVTDFMVLDAKYFLCLSLYVKAYMYLKIAVRDRLNKAGRTVFLMFSSFEGSEFKRSPDVEDFKLAVEKSIKRCINRIFSFSSLETNTDFRNYFRALHEFSVEVFQESLSPATILSINPEVVRYSSQITDLLFRYSQEIQEFGRTWQTHFKQYSQNKQFKLKKLINFDVLSLSHTFEKYQKQLKTFRSLPDHALISIFKLDLAEIKNKLIPSSVEIIESLRKFLPNLAYSKANSLSTDLSSFNSKLFSVPKDVHEYILLLNSIKQVEESVESVALSVLDLKDFIEMLEFHNIGVSSDLKDRSAEVSKAYEKMRNRLSYLYMRYESDKAKFTRILRNEVKNVKPRLETVQALLENKAFMSVCADPNYVLGILKPATDEVESLYKDSQNFTAYQDTLSVPRTNFDLVKSANRHFQMLLSLWNSISKWEYKNKQWGYTQLKEMKVEDIKKELEKFYRVGYKSLILSPENPVPTNFISKIEKVQVLVNIVEHLQNPAIREKHWKAIETITGFNPDIQNGITFATIFLKDLQSHIGQIKEVVEKATREAEIEKLAKEIFEIWELEEFDLMEDKAKEDYVMRKLKRARATSETEVVLQGSEESGEFIEDENED